MADGEKPYRVYKGGRTRGKVPTAPRPERQSKAESGRPKTSDRPRWGRRIGLAVLLIGVLLIVWFVLGYLSFRGGVDEANARLPKTATANPSGGRKTDMAASADSAVASTPGPRPPNHAAMRTAGKNRR